MIDAWSLIRVRSFERYPEGDAVASYGKQTDDPFGHHFPEFEYMQT